MCFKHNSGINLGLKKILVEIITVAEMLCPLLLESREGETLEMKKQRRPWKKFCFSYENHLPACKKVGLPLCEAGQTKEMVVNG